MDKEKLYKNLDYYGKVTLDGFTGIMIEEHDEFYRMYIPTLALEGVNSYFDGVFDCYLDGTFIGNLYGRPFIESEEAYDAINEFNNAEKFVRGFIDSDGLFDIKYSVHNVYKEDRMVDAIKLMLHEFSSEQGIDNLKKLNDFFEEDGFYY